MRKRYLRHALLAVASMFTGAVVVILWGVYLVYSYAPAGPSLVKGLEGKYYNLVYTLSPCPSAPLIHYEDKSIAFSYYGEKDSPDMERHGIHGVPAASVPLAVRMLRYSFIDGYTAGNLYMVMYRPAGRKPAGEKELKEFVTKNAVEQLGGQPEIVYGIIPGAVFSAQYRLGNREGIFFSTPDGALHQFKNQDQSMQRGDIPFGRRLLASLGIGSYSMEDPALGGMKNWFFRPYREKISDCNYALVTRTMRVRRNKP